MELRAYMKPLVYWNSEVVAHLVRVLFSNKAPNKVGAHDGTRICTMLLVSSAAVEPWGGH